MKAFKEKEEEVLVTHEDQSQCRRYVGSGQAAILPHLIGGDREKLLRAQSFPTVRTSPPIREEAFTTG